MTNEQSPTGDGPQQDKPVTDGSERLPNYPSAFLHFARVCEEVPWPEATELHRLDEVNLENYVASHRILKGSKAFWSNVFGRKR